MSPPLPIDEHLPDILRRLERHGAVVLVAEPGAGKTTRVPPALLDRPAAGAPRGVLVSEPRRIAARLAAHRVASERGCPVGGEVGYTVRHDDRTSRETLLRFVTEGVLLKRLLDPRDELREIRTVVLDELHERHLETDLALALLRRLRRGPRPDLELVAMSATMSPEPVADFLDGAVLEVPGRAFPVEIELASGPDDRPLERRVAGALRRARARLDPRGVLVFLPGAAEIRRAFEACAPWAREVGLDLRMLHGSQPLEQQAAALTPGDSPRAILSTNVAETSITVEEVDVVIDSGLARVAGHSPWSGLPSLEVRPISRASARQRAGRAGRTAPGTCLRLYTREDYDRRPEVKAPEILRADLCDALLRTAVAGCPLDGELVLLDTPAEASFEAARALLRRLGAFDEEGAPTELGRRIAELPTHPRLGRLIVEAARRGAPARGALLAALLEGRDVLRSARAVHGPRGPSIDAEGPSDGLVRLERLEALGRRLRDPSALRRAGFDVGATRAVLASAEALARAATGRSEPIEVAIGRERDDDEALLLATLAAFPDRVARRRRPRGSSLAFAGGGAGTLSPESVVRGSELIVAVDAVSRARGGASVRAASAIEPDWLIELFADDLVESREIRFDADAERVVAVERLRYEKLTLDETISLDPRGAEVEAALFEAARGAGLERFVDADALETLRARLELVADHRDDVEALDDADLLAALEEACAGRASFAELARLPWLDLLAARAGPRASEALRRLAPLTVEIPGRRRVPVRYRRGAPPSIASRLQDFFGAREGPTVAAGRVPLVLHLLAPNQRDVQVTTDLAGFWERHYPSIRKTLARRYPKHAWPEDPLTASPSRPGRRRA